MDDFQPRSYAFLQEFKAQSGAIFDERVSFADLRHRGAGRGLVAIQDIPADTELFTIPRQYVISVENSELSELLPHIFDDQVNEEDESEEGETLPKPWLNLILVLLHDYFHRSTSKWQAYWEVLPNNFDTLMFWSDVELSELQASTVRGRIGRESANKMFQERVIPLVKQYDNVFYPSGVPRMTDDELLILSHRMGSLIMAYAFDLETSHEDSDEEGEDGWAEDRDGQMAMGMVPMADMLNADAEFNAHLEHGSESLTMRSLRPVKQGEEILNYYGPLPNCDLLRRYGYTSPKHARYDVVELSWDTVEKVVGQLYNTPTTSGIPHEEIEDTFVLERESGDPDETGINNTEAKFTTFPEELVEQTTTLIAAAIKLSATSRPTEQDKRKLKHGFLKVMARVLTARIAEYATTLEQDETSSNGQAQSVRFKMALDVRMGEKRLLREAQNLVGELLAKYSDVEMSGTENGIEEGRAAKRQKRSR